MRYLVVEPHADDTFLSLGGHIEDWCKNGIDVTIATIYSGTRKRARDAKAYADAVGASWFGMGLAEGATKLEDPTALEDACSGLRKLILKSGRVAKLFIPLGVGHPEHIATSDHLSGDWMEEGRIYYYWEQPYCVIGKNRHEVEDRSEGMRVRSYMKPGLRKYRHIPLFKDQAKFFYYNPAESLSRTFEMVVSR